MQCVRHDLISAPSPEASVRVGLDLGKKIAGTTLHTPAVRVGRAPSATTRVKRPDVRLPAVMPSWLSRPVPPGLEAAYARLTVKRMPGLGRGANAIARVVCGVAAFALTALTVALLVIGPAQVQSASAEKDKLTVSNRAATSHAESGMLTVTQESKAPSSTRIE